MGADESVRNASGAGKAAASSRRQWAPYLEATSGFKNHWYPALFSHELKDNDVKGVLIAGHEIALRRAKGKTYALQDRCLHRGVRMSRRPLCLSDELMSCWYHGYSYGLEDGVLRTIVASPDDPILGKVRIRTYPVEEHNGMIFVFVGDEDYKPVPPLSSDLPLRIGADEDPQAVAYILDEHVFVRGIHRTGNSNWRLAVENGYDPGHWLIHMGNTIIASADVLFPLGAQPVSDEAVRVIEEEDGPKGVMMMYNRPEAWNMVLENPVLGLKARGTKPYYLRTSMYVPGVLLVEHWPIPGWAQYEWYVPTDETHHEYWEVLVAHCRNEADLKDAEYRYNNVFEPLALRDFNDNDLFAREAMQPFYETGDGWNRETLCQLDNALTAWRKVASRYNRGIQERPASPQTNGAGGGNGHR